MTLQYTYKSLCSHHRIGPVLLTSTSPPQITLPRPYTNPSQSIPLSLNFPCPFCNPAMQPVPPSGSGVFVILSSTTNSIPDKWRVLRLCNFEDLTAKDWEANRIDGKEVYRHVAWIARPVGIVGVGDDGEKRVGVGWKRRVGDNVMETRFEGLLQKLRGLGV